MKRYKHLREKARQFRRQGATLPEICERSALGKSTVYAWIKDIPIPRTMKQSEQLRQATLAVRRKFERQREEWYNEAYQSASKSLSDLTLRDFVILYAAEGLKRDRNRVEICNSNPSIMRVAHCCISRLTQNSNIRYRLQCHTDNSEEELKDYWANVLGIEARGITVMRKSNAGELSGRRWRSKYGVLTIAVGDTRLRCMIQAWMDYLQHEWSTF